MPDKLHKTKGIVLRAVKYGETSLIVTIFIELFGIQSYLINGVRTSSKKGSGKASLFQPSAILDMVVYHNELKQLNRIREFKWAVIYNHIFSDVPKNALAQFMVEVLLKCLKQPEPHVELFQFCEDVFTKLDDSKGTKMANLPLFFVLHLSHFFGFRPDDNFSEERNYFDLMEGSFVSNQPHHPYFLEKRQAEFCSEILKVRQVEELENIQLNGENRRLLLHAFEKYYSFHVQDFGTLKSLPVISAILS